MVSTRPAMEIGGMHELGKRGDGRQRQTETDRDRQRQTETDRDRHTGTCTNGNRHSETGGGLHASGTRLTPAGLRGVTV
jgi:hypothetical protein